MQKNHTCPSHWISTFNSTQTYIAAVTKKPLVFLNTHSTATLPNSLKSCFVLFQIWPITSKLSVCFVWSEQTAAKIQLNAWQHSKQEARIVKYSEHEIQVLIKK